ncbi:hypothetical protein CEE44_02455 [Candidatus Woesearchaeota archaeon B3_Woes]|nr:MAG: hypothetical protein CEE44_02455 [Candidatus Woesearchaeota archaeon B3_Woes]
MDKKGIGKALTLLLSIAIITLEITVFYSAYGEVFKPINFAVKEIPKNIDNNILLLNLLRTETADGAISDMIIQSYLSDEYYTLEKHITIFIVAYYGENYIWHLSIENTKKAGNYNFIQGILKGKKKYEASTLIPSYTKEAIEVELSIYKK